MAVDPNDIKHVSDLIDVKSKRKYERNWRDFCKTMEISRDKRPTPELIFNYLKDCRDGPKGYAPTTLWTVFSCLNKFCLYLYPDMDLNVSTYFTLFQYPLKFLIPI